MSSEIPPTPARPQRRPVDPLTVGGAHHFHLLQQQEGADYGYASPEAATQEIPRESRRPTTAIVAGSPHSGRIGGLAPLTNLLGPTARPSTASTVTAGGSHGGVSFATKRTPAAYGNSVSATPSSSHHGLSASMQRDSVSAASGGGGSSSGAAGGIRSVAGHFSGSKFSVTNVSNLSASASGTGSYQQQNNNNNNGYGGQHRDPAAMLQYTPSTSSASASSLHNSRPSAVAAMPSRREASENVAVFSHHRDFNNDGDDASSVSRGRGTTTHNPNPNLHHTLLGMEDEPQTPSSAIALGQRDYGDDDNDENDNYALRSASRCPTSLGRSAGAAGTHTPAARHSTGTNASSASLGTAPRGASATSASASRERTYGGSKHPRQCSAEVDTMLADLKLRSQSRGGGAMGMGIGAGMMGLGMAAYGGLECASPVKGARRQQQRVQGVSSTDERQSTDDDDDGYGNYNAYDNERESAFEVAHGAPPLRREASPMARRTGLLHSSGRRFGGASAEGDDDGCYSKSRSPQAHPHPQGGGAATTNHHHHHHTNGVQHSGAYPTARTGGLFASGNLSTADPTARASEASSYHIATNMSHNGGGGGGMGVSNSYSQSQSQQRAPRGGGGLFGAGLGGASSASLSMGRSNSNFLVTTHSMGGGHHMLGAHSVSQTQLGDYPAYGGAGLGDNSNSYGLGGAFSSSQHHSYSQSQQRGGGGCYEDAAPSAFVPSKLDTEFREVRELGSGYFGRVILAEELSTGQYFAVKISSEMLSLRDEHRLKHERNIMHALRGSPHCVQLAAAWVEGALSVTRSGGGGGGNNGYYNNNNNSHAKPQLFLQMPWYECGSVGTIARDRRERRVRWAEKEVVVFLAHMAMALDAMHSVNIAHVDVKPDNILVDAGGSYFLGDFGLSLTLDDETQRPLSLSQNYLISASQTGAPSSNAGGNAKGPATNNNPNMHDLALLGGGGCSSTGFSLGGGGGNGGGFFSNANVSQSVASQDEGDCRYIPLDMMNRKAHYKAGDVFALGVSCYELMSGREAPARGDEFHSLRNRSDLDELLLEASAADEGGNNVNAAVGSAASPTAAPSPSAGRFSRPLVELVLAMIQYDPTVRPTARDILQHPLLRPTADSLAAVTAAVAVAAEHIPSVLPAACAHSFINEHTDYCSGAHHGGNGIGAGGRGGAAPSVISRSDTCYGAAGGGGAEGYASPSVDNPYGSPENPHDSTVCMPSSAGNKSGNQNTTNNNYGSPLMSNTTFVCSTPKHQHLPSSASAANHHRKSAAAAGDRTPAASEDDNCSPLLAGTLTLRGASIPLHSPSPFFNPSDRTMTAAMVGGADSDTALAAAANSSGSPIEAGGATPNSFFGGGGGLAEGSSQSQGGHAAMGSRGNTFYSCTPLSGAGGANASSSFASGASGVIGQPDAHTVEALSLRMRLPPASLADMRYHRALLEVAGYLLDLVNKAMCGIVPPARSRYIQWQLLQRRGNANVNSNNNGGVTPSSSAFASGSGNCVVVSACTPSSSQRRTDGPTPMANGLGMGMATPSAARSRGGAGGGARPMTTAPLKADTSTPSAQRHAYSSAGGGAAHHRNDLLSTPLRKPPQQQQPSSSAAAAASGVVPLTSINSVVGGGGLGGATTTSAASMLQRQSAFSDKGPHLFASSSASASNDNTLPTTAPLRSAPEGASSGSFMGRFAGGRGGISIAVGGSAAAAENSIMAAAELSTPLTPAAMDDSPYALALQQQTPQRFRR